MRWLVLEDKLNISSTTRESAIGEVWSGKALLLTLYGGKLTSYRSLSEKIGDRVSACFGERRSTGTKDKKNWFSG